jgi:hypothetical protein
MPKDVADLVDQEGAQSFRCSLDQVRKMNNMGQPSCKDFGCGLFSSEEEQSSKSCVREMMTIHAKLSELGWCKDKIVWHKCGPHFYAYSEVLSYAGSFIH